MAEVETIYESPMFTDGCIFADSFYNSNDPLEPQLRCRFNGGESECIGFLNCARYRQRRVEPPEQESFDVVSRPSHYAEGRKYEPKDVIRDWNLNFNLGNTVKYVARAGRKDDILQDLKKARQYLDFEIEYLEKEREEK